MRMVPPKQDYLRIATEEAVCPPEMLTIYRKILENKENTDPGFNSMWNFYMFSESDRARHIRAHLVDVDDKRLRHMDESGIDKAVLALTSPGVQVMNKETAVSFSITSNDWLADAVKRHPTRYAGLAACAPQDPAAAAREIERAVGKLGLKGVVINSHTNSEYLDDEKFWPIFEAAEAMDAPIYLHPQTPNKDMFASLVSRGIDGAIYGFSVETSMHMLRIVLSGAFDRFPKLQFVLGHVGESLPFTFYRLDYMQAASVKSGRYPTMKAKRKISDYMKENLYYTNSGVAWEPPIKFLQEQVGVDRVMYAMDYPYQYTPEEVTILDGMQMAPEAKKKFFQTNAERIFKL